MTEITVRLEAKSDPQHAEVKQVQLTGLLHLFLGEVGFEGAAIRSQTDTYYEPGALVHTTRVIASSTIEL